MSDAVDDAFAALEAHRDSVEHLSMAELLAEPDRFAAFSLEADGLLLDFSRHQATRETISLLVDLARAADVEGKRDAMFAGEKINVTENRAVLHVALRAKAGRASVVDGKDVSGEVAGVLARVLAFAEEVRTGRVRGSSGERFTDVVNIGIGGSDLGPAMATRALSPYRSGGPRVHFVSNVDGAHIHDTLSGLDPARTLFIIASKTFTTLETMANAATARRWIASALGEGAVPPHFAAVSTAIDRAAAFGIDGSRVFGFWDWVGGRYSVWSAIGLPLAIAIGARNFQAFLDGAHAMDEHFRTAPLERNMPVIMGLLGVWYRDVRGFATHAVVPYDQRLERFAAHLQQLDMESNGKRVTRTGRPVTRATGPVVWGEPGTNGQHAFFQLLHQGTEIVPVDFLIAAQGHEPDLAEHHDMLVASCLAQAEALAHGRSAEAVARAMREKGASEEEIARLVPHRTFPGNRPSNVLLYRRLDPFTLGQLIALYEHRVFVQGAVWDVNSFDQWGVELGKELAAGLLPVVRGEAEPDGRDASTAGLVRRIRLLRGK